MKNRLGVISTFILLFLGTVSFTFSQNINKHVIFENLRGNWSYLYYLDAFTDTIVRQEPNSNTNTVTFSKDSTFKSYINAKLDYKMKFTITDNGTILSKRGTFQEREMIVEFKGKDTLSISEICPDCESTVYIRKK